MPFAVVGSDKAHQVDGKEVLGRLTNWGLIEGREIYGCILLLHWPGTDCLILGELGYFGPSQSQIIFKLSVHIDTLISSINQECQLRPVFS